jgi:hypothetical protein
MGKGSSQPDEITQTSEPWSGLIPYLTGGTHYGQSSTPQGGYGQYGSYGGLGGYPGSFGFSGSRGNGPVGILPEASNLYRSGPSMSMGFNPQQLQAQNQALDYAGNFGDMFDPYKQSITGALSGGLNPHLDAAIASASRPINQAYDERIQPGIRGQATGTGNVGSSRTGVMEGIAERGRYDALGDVSTRLAYDAYGKDQDQQARAWAMAPQMFEAGQMPFDIAGGVGDARYNQALQEQMEPYQKFDWYRQPIMGSMGGGYGTQSRDSYQGSDFMSKVGGAASTIGSILSLVSMIPPSDPRLKDDVKLVGQQNGLNVYEWEWNEKANKLGLHGSDRGYMATEVPEKYVGSHMGYMTVNYNALGGKP